MSKVGHSCMCARHRAVFRNSADFKRALNRLRSAPNPLRLHKSVAEIKRRGDGYTEALPGVAGASIVLRYTNSVLGHGLWTVDTSAAVGAGDVMGLMTGACKLEQLHNHDVTPDAGSAYDWHPVEPLAGDDSVVHRYIAGDEDCTIFALVNQWDAAHAHNCAVVSCAAYEGVMLMVACREIPPGEELRLSYSPQAKPPAQQPPCTMYAEVRPSHDAAAQPELSACSAKGLLHDMTTGKTLARVPAHSDRLEGVFSSNVAPAACLEVLRSANGRGEPVPAAPFLATPHEFARDWQLCQYAVTRKDANQPLTNLLYSPAQATLFVSPGPGQEPVPVETRAGLGAAAQGLFVNLHTWEDGGQMTMLSLADLPPNGCPMRALVCRVPKRARH